MNAPQSPPPCPTPRWAVPRARASAEAGPLWKLGCAAVPRARAGAHRIALLLVLLAWRAAASPAFARTVTVHILGARPPHALALSSEAGGRVRVGMRVDVWRAGVPLRLCACAPRSIVVRFGDAPPEQATAVTVVAPVMTCGGRRYTGAITARCPDGATLFLVNRTPLEDYVGGVVTSEALPGTPLQALRAQAVAARSFAVASAHLLTAQRGRPRGPHAEEGFDFCDLTHCQSFRGLGRGAALQAARDTRGLVLWSEGRVVAAWYHSTCGGRTAAPREAGADPALRSVPDVAPSGRAWCADSPHFRWHVDLGVARVRDALNRDPSTRVGRHLRTLRVTRRYPDGRVARIELRGSRVRQVSGQAFWMVLGRELGWGNVESAWFYVHRCGRVFEFDGRGLGHGCGMCQYGAAAMARAGYHWRAILAHYYPGTTVRPLPPPSPEGART